MSQQGWVGPLLAALLASACGGVSDYQDDDACKSAGYSIASRTLDCTGSLHLANSRYVSLLRSTRCTAHDLAKGFTCMEDDPPSCDDVNPFMCAVMINEVTCAEVASYGDDIERWL